MSEPIIFTITVPDGLEEQVPQIMQLGLFAIFKGTESYSVPGGTEFRLNQLGVNKIGQDKLAALLSLSAYGPSCSGTVGPRFIEMTNEEYQKAVPVQFPESTKPTFTEEVVEGAEGEEPTINRIVTGSEQMTWAEYAPWATVSNDGTRFLVNMSERAWGDTCGDGLSWEEFIIWYAEFTDRILTENQAQIKLASEEYRSGE